MRDLLMEILAHFASHPLDQLVQLLLGDGETWYECREQGWVQLRNCNWLWKIDVIVIESGSPYVAVIVIEYLL